MRDNNTEDRNSNSEEENVTMKQDLLSTMDMDATNMKGIEIERGRTRGIRGGEDFVGRLGKEEEQSLFEEGEERHDTEGESQAKASTLQTMFNIINLYVGMGLLSKSYAAAQGGFLSLILILIFSFMLNYSGKIIVRCFKVIEETQHWTYGHLGQRLLGTFGKWFVFVNVVAGSMAGVVMALIIIWQSVEVLLAPYFVHPSDQPIHLDSNLFSSTIHDQYSQYSVMFDASTSSFTWIIVSVSTVLILPTVWIRQYSNLSFVSAIGFCCSVVIVLVVMIFFFGHISSVREQQYDLFRPATFPIAAGVFLMSFSGHTCLPSLFNSMRKTAHYERLLDCCFGFMLVLYTLMSVFGYLSFGRDSDVLISNDLLRYSTTTAEKVVNKAMITFVAVSNYCTIAPWIHIVTDQIEEFFLNKERDPSLSIESSASSSFSAPSRMGGKKSFLRYMLLSTSVFLLSFLVAVVSSNHLGYIEAVLGGVSAITTSLILPSLFYYMTFRSVFSRWEKIGTLAMLAFGCVAVIWITSSSTINLIHGKT